MSSSPEPVPRPRPLDGLRVVDFSSSVAGQYAGRLLAMQGADVVLVEPPEGTPTRRTPPLSPDGTESYLFRHLNQGKRAAAWPGAGLLDGVDVVLRDQGAPLPVPLAATVVDCELGDFPPDGPYARWQGSEMVHQALSGVMNATGSVDREPIYGLGQRASYATGTTAYISVLAALHERRRSGRGQQVRASVFESTAAMGQNLVSQASYNGTEETRAAYPGFLAVLRCRDAWVVLFAIRNWPSLCHVFGLDELLDDPRFTTSGDRLANWPAVVARLQERAAGMAADDVVAGLQRGRVSAEKVTGLAELVESEQWRLRSMLSEVGDGESALRRLFVVDDADGPVDADVPGPSPRLQVAEPAGGAR
ncbi:crotonobetainyl-CoA:carnitine CoA-transferase CaiB-like acyl-CoA transferase [Pseudonocardia kunmingensis]|uniref:Crotonobetainyl-CoA:carnitine CoA-transferase CaiB-like acyl-CoA transferase n=1 Tax=Pseudonocardia kunmingensis TaxID=630975 RepID=A0A543CXC2_9PSEU|nr:crotonobetainyl-CoA:carnitine CoA-transferase CaiB-like acyl-CoA transferase [Pseudonocardia kunmingensis]